MAPGTLMQANCRHPVVLACSRVPGFVEGPFAVWLLPQAECLFLGFPFSRPVHKPQDLCHDIFAQVPEGRFPDKNSPDLYYRGYIQRGALGAL